MKACLRNILPNLAVFINSQSSDHHLFWVWLQSSAKIKIRIIYQIFVWACVRHNISEFVRKIKFKAQESGNLKKSVRKTKYDLEDESEKGYERSRLTNWDGWKLEWMV